MLHHALLREDESAVIAAIPKPLSEVLVHPKFENRVFIAGGFLRAIVAGEPINDIDIFTDTPATATELLSDLRLANVETKVHTSPQAFSIDGFGCPVQIITAWHFKSALDCIKSFDFTICQAAISQVFGNWESCCSREFYSDLASRRLRYTDPSRVETHLGGSLTRILKHYQRGEVDQGFRHSALLIYAC